MHVGGTASNFVVRVCVPSAGGHEAAFAPGGDDLGPCVDHRAAVGGDDQRLGAAVQPVPPVLEVADRGARHRGVLGQLLLAPAQHRPSGPALQRQKAAVARLRHIDLQQ